MRSFALFLALFVLLHPAAGRCVDLYIQAEYYTNSHNIDWDEIRRVDDKLYGLGYPGEWTEYSYYPRSFGAYDALMICWGELGVSYSLSLTIWDADSGEQTIYFSFTGRGDCYG